MALHEYPLETVPKEVFETFLSGYHQPPIVVFDAKKKVFETFLEPGSERYKLNDRDTLVEMPDAETIKEFMSRDDLHPRTIVHNVETRRLERIR